MTRGKNNNHCRKWGEEPHPVEDDWDEGWENESAPPLWLWMLCFGAIGLVAALIWVAAHP